MQEIFLFRLSWGNPNTEPPAGRPRILAEIASAVRHPCPPEFEAACQRLHTLGDGYWVSFGMLEPRRKNREWSRERKAACRRQKLEQRIKRKYPLFADQLIQEEIAKKPDYFDGGALNADVEAAREAALQRRDDLFNRFASAIGVLFVYEDEKAAAPATQPEIVTSDKWALSEMTRWKGLHVDLHDWASK